MEDISHRPQGDLEGLRGALQIERAHLGRVEYQDLHGESWILLRLRVLHEPRNAVDRAKLRVRNGIGSEELVVSVHV
jgi:hypothetical protein